MRRRGGFLILLMSWMFAGFFCPLASALASDGAQMDPTELRDASLSPNGRYVVAWGRQPYRLRGPQPPTSVRIVDVRCALKAGGSRCVQDLQMSVMQISTAYWTKKSEAVLLHASRGFLILRKGPKGWSATLKSPSQLNPVGLPSVITDDLLRAETEGRTVESVASVWRALPTEVTGADGMIDPNSVESMDKFDWAGADGNGKIVYWLDQSGEEARVFTREGVVARIPKYLSSVPLFAPRDTPQFVVRYRGDGFFLWLGSYGDNGSLTFFSRGRRKVYRLPEVAGSPLQPVYTPSASRVLGVFDADRFYPLEGTGGGAVLDAYVRTVRIQDPSLELVAVKASETGVAVLKFRSADGISRWRLFDGRSRRGVEIFSVRDVPDDADGRAYSRISSTSVRIPAQTGDLPARLYRAMSPTVRSRGLVVTFHGGPGVNMLYNEHDATRRLVRLGFDVLDVDYRGSPGYGWRHFSVLRRALDTVISQDLEAAVAWARDQVEYQDRTVGFYGISAGGIAGVSAVSKPVQGLDFIVLDSTFISWGGPAPGSKCVDQQYWAMQLWGGEQTPDGCKYGGALDLDVRTASKTPVLMLVGERDTQTDPTIAASWFERIGRLGACVEMISSSTGKHGLVSWPTADQRAADLAFREWLGAVERGETGTACGRRIAYGT